MRAVVVWCLLAVGPSRAELGSQLLVDTATIRTDSSESWHFQHETGLPPAPPETIGTRKYLSSGDRSHIYDVPGGKLLRLRVRSQASAHAGMLAFMQIRVNGELLTTNDVVGRPLRFTAKNGMVIDTARKETLFVVYHAPDFSPLPPDYKYFPVDLPDHDPFSYSFRIESYLVSGQNRIEIRNTRKPPKANVLVLADVRVQEILAEAELRSQAESLAAQATRYRQAATRLFADIPNLPNSPGMQAALGRMRMTNWAAANSSPMTEYDRPDEAEANARRIRADGATVAIIRGRHFRLDSLDETERHMRFYKLVADACRTSGILPFAHLDFTLFWQPGYRVISEHPDWPQQALDDGTPHHWCCTNNPSFREAHIAYVEQICRQGIVGFMLDEINFAHVGKYYCGCSYCRERFEACTGFRLPEHDDRNVLGNNRHPLWRLWLEWQHASIVRFKSELVQRLRQINPDAAVLSYSTNIYAPARTGNVYEEGRVCFTGTEGTNRVYGQFACLFADHRIADAFNRRWGKPTWAQYPVGTEAERVWASAFFAPVVNNKPWGWRRYHHSEELRTVFTWPHLEEAMAFAEPVADVGVLLSTSNRWGPPLEGTVHAVDTYGLCQGLGLGGIQFDPVPGLHLRPEHLAPFRALLIGYAPAMALATIRVVDEWIKQGGTAVVMGLAGRYDRLGFPLGSDAFLSHTGLLGLSRCGHFVYHRYDAQLENRQAEVITPEHGIMTELGQRLTVPPTYRFRTLLAAEGEQQILARFDDYTPAMVSVPRGEGRIIWVGVLPGVAVAQRRMDMQSVQNESLQRSGVAFICALARFAAAGAQRVRVQGQGILGTAWRRDRTVWVRLVNVAGAMPQPGRKVDDIPVTYPELGLVRIVFNLPLSGQPVLLTPDRSDPVPLTVTRGKDGDTVDLEPGMFRRFALVRMELTP